jgi:catechol 2,3-dioxygenase-like lactoylglutathione lyase family enzyme
MPSPPASARHRADVGLTHVALAVRDVDASAEFYACYAKMKVVHRRVSDATRVVWLSDLTRPFVVVLLESPRVEGRLGGSAHLGVGCHSREEVDRLCELAQRENRLALGPTDAGPPVGYWALLRDPDGHNLELSHGQEVGIAVGEAQDPQRG